MILSTVTYTYNDSFIGYCRNIVMLTVYENNINHTSDRKEIQSQILHRYEDLLLS